MSHIPQPGGGENLQTEFNSEQVSPQAPTIAPIETTTPSTQEVSRAAGERSNIPTYFYSHWRRMATLEWTTNDPVGKLLFQAPVSPLHMDKTLAWLMSLFHAWGGDFEIMFRVVATGFHAGQVAIVSFPPRIDLKNMSNPIDYTIFPYDVMDVKKLEPQAFVLRDRRNTKYHYLRHDLREQLDEDIGGRVGIFVDTPLTTSATGVQKISLAIWVRCASNFEVAYVRPPLIDQPVSKIYVPPTLIKLLNTATDSYLASTAKVPTHFVQWPQAHKIMTRCYSNCSKLDGNMYQPYTSNPRLNRVQNNLTAIFCTLTSGTGQSFLYPKSNSLYSYLPETLPTVVYISPGGAASTVIYRATIKTFYSSAQIVVDGEYTSNPNSYVYFSEIVDKPMNTTFPNDNIPLLKAGEAFIAFGSSNTLDSACMQTLFLANYFHNRELDGVLDEGYAFLILVSSKATKLPLFHIKLHQGGFFTAPAQGSSAAFYDLSLISFSGEGIIGVLDSFPDIVGGAANLEQHAILAAALYGRPRQHRQRKTKHLSLKPADGLETTWQPDSLEPSLEEEDSQASSSINQSEPLNQEKTDNEM